MTVVNDDDDVDGPLLLDLKGVYYDVILKGKKKATFCLLAVVDLHFPAKFFQLSCYVLFSLSLCFVVKI